MQAAAAVVVDIHCFQSDPQPKQEIEHKCHSVVSVSDCMRVCLTTPSKNCYKNRLRCRPHSPKKNRPTVVAVVPVSNGFVSRARFVALL